MEAKHPLAVWRDKQDPPLTQQAFAEFVHTSRWTINSIEKGRRQPSRDLILAISQATGGAVGFTELVAAA